MGGPIIRSKTKQLKEVLNWLIQEQNHDQRVTQMDHKAWNKPINEIITILKIEGVPWHDLYHVTIKGSRVDLEYPVHYFAS